jgi:hypothetical protein
MIAGLSAIWVLNECIGDYALNEKPVADHCQQSIVRIAASSSLMFHTYKHELAVRSDLPAQQRL